MTPIVTCHEKKRYKKFNEEDLKGTVHMEKGMRFRTID